MFFQGKDRERGVGTGRSPGDPGGREGAANTPAAVIEPASEFISRTKAACARLIRKVYEADPSECPKCEAPMRVIALIDDLGVVRRIIEHPGRWAPDPAERGPPAITQRHRHILAAGEARK